MWSLACMVFELITGDLLFDPRASQEYTADEGKPPPLAYILLGLRELMHCM